MESLTELLLMEMECLTEFSTSIWIAALRSVRDQVLKEMLSLKDIGDVTSSASLRAPSDHTCSSPPQRGDDKDGHKRNASAPQSEDDEDGHKRNASPSQRGDDKDGSKRSTSASQDDDDEDGRYVFALGEDLTSRFEIRSKMGEGTFGQVLECWDRVRKEMVAIKISRANEDYRETAMIEIDVLQQLEEHDIGGNRYVQMQTWFDHRNHICIVFEKLGPSLYDFLKKNGRRPCPIDLVRELGRQLLEFVAFLHDLGLIHTDLKPNNILFVSSTCIKLHDDSYSKRSPESSAIKLIDFGSTAFGHEDNSYVVSTRQYRAPEVILGLGWSYPCDMWSVGCILAELCTGQRVFEVSKNLEHLAMMERVLGPLPEQMMNRAETRVEKYTKKGRLNWPEGASGRESIEAVQKMPQLQNLVRHLADGDLMDLLQGLLKYEPLERLTASDALKHPFFEVRNQ